MKKEANSVLKVKSNIAKKSKKVGSILLIKNIKKATTDKKKKINKTTKSGSVVSSPIVKTDSETSKELSPDKVQKAVEITFNLIEKTSNTTLLDDEIAITLQITCIKIPKCPLRTVRYPIPNSLVNDSTDICFIVADLKRGRKVDPEPTVNHYEDLLSAAGITNIKILPFTQLKLEYSQFEAKRRLLSLYDVFLVDGKISGHVFHVLGKTFIKARKLPISVKVDEANIKYGITKALNKTSIVLTPRGNTTLTKIGHNKMTPKQVTENIISASNWLKKNYPGGWENIEAIYIKSPKSMAIPVHVTFKSRNDVKIPVIVHHPKNILKDVSGELSTIPGATICFDANGKIKIKKEKDNDLSDEELEEIDDDSDNTSKKPKKKTTKANKSEIKEQNENEKEIKTENIQKSNKRNVAQKISKTNQNSKVNEQDKDANEEPIKNQKPIKKSLKKGDLVQKVKIKKGKVAKVFSMRLVK